MDGSGVIDVSSHCVLLKVYDSLSKKLVPFEFPLNRVISWYNCGPTVYDSSHLGHARNYVVFDTIRRIFEDYFNVSVNFCMNITDIDDKIINKSNELGVSYSELSRFYEASFLSDLRSLNCRDPTLITRVSEYMDCIILFIEKIISNGYAYAANGSVYFDVQAFLDKPEHKFPRLEPSSLNMSGNKVDEALLESLNKSLDSQSVSLSDFSSDKRNICDFALWKKAKQDEPSWQSPWGAGRPGWHIECSAMACAVFDSPLYIHSGGVDLRFPHHDNELAQSEAYNDEPNWVKYFFHCGHLHINGLKMSKSLKNFITVSALLKDYPAQVLRILFLLHDWRQSMSYDPNGDSLREAHEYHRCFVNFMSTVKPIIMKNCQVPSYEDIKSVNLSNLSGISSSLFVSDTDKVLLRELNSAVTNVHNAYCNNFNTSGVLEILKNLVGSYNVYARDLEPSHQNGLLLSKVVAFIHKHLEILGLTKQNNVFAYTGGDSSDDGALYNRFLASIELLGNLRHKVRAFAKNFMKRGDSDVKKQCIEMLESCDKIRSSSEADIGVKFEDSGNKGYSYKVL